MTDLQRLTRLFGEQVGVAETPPGSNNVKYNTDYYGGAVQGDNFPWCCAFIWDVFRMAALSKLFCGGEKTAYCPYVVNWAKAHNAWVTDNYRQGDIILYDWNNDGVADHIGFCEIWNGPSGIVIEGNAGNAVRRLTRYPTQIMGAYRPSYPADNVKEETPVDEKTNTTPETPEYYIVQEGDNLWSIAVRFLGSGLKYPMLMEANGLKSATIHPGDKLRIPGADDRKTFTITVSPTTYTKLQTASRNAGKSVGEIIDGMMEAASV